MTHPRTTRASRKESLLPDLGALDGRSVRAWTERMAVRQLPDGRYAVSGESDATYVVDLEAGRCTCPDHEIRGERCKHVRRVALEVTQRRVPPPGRRARRCAVCTTSLDRTDPGEPPLCPDCRPEPGEVVVDAESGARLLVVSVTDRRADEVGVPGRGWSVADHPTNRGYDPADPVVEVVYPEDVRSAGSPRRYAFPASRLVRLHDLPPGPTPEAPESRGSGGR